MWCNRNSASIAVPECQSVSPSLVFNCVLDTGS